MPPTPFSPPAGAGRLTDPSRAPARVSRESRPGQSVSGGEGRRALWLLVLAAAWRWRRELSPVAATLGLLLVPAVGHAASEGLAWAPLVAGAAGVGAVALWGHRPIHRWWAAGSAVAGAWMAAAWWVGLGDPVVLGGFLALLASVAWVWIRYVHPRARVRVVGGSVWPWHWERWQFQRTAVREIRRAAERWIVACSTGRVPWSEIRAATADIDEDFDLLTVEFVPGLLDRDLSTPRAASAIGAPEGHIVIVQPDRDSERPANVAQIKWYRNGMPPIGATEEEPDEAGEVDEPEARLAPVDPEAERLERLRAALEHIGAQTVSARGLAKAARLPHSWVNDHITQLAPRLGLRRVKGGWQRLAMAAGEER